MYTLNEETPFTAQEEEIMDLLVAAHTKFCDLKVTGYHTTKDWQQAFHALQNVLIGEALIRRYPNYFLTT